jgi:hypothetical protein
MLRVLPRRVENRREFFRAAARYSLLTLLATGAAVMGRKSVAAGERCVNRGICSACGVFDRCGLPQALSAKEAGVKRDV